MMIMTCKEIQEVMPDLALGLAPVSGENATHLRSCQVCAEKLSEMQNTMALLDEWQAPQPSPYFDTRLKARLREEQAKAPAGGLTWFRKPIFAAVATVVDALRLGIGLIERKSDDRPV